MASFVAIFSGSGTVRVTDMTNAGKRGKTCAQVSFNPKNWNDNSATAQLADWCHLTPEQRANITYPRCLETGSFHELIADDFDALCAELVGKADLDRVDVDVRTIRGVDAPKPKLKAGFGDWSASATDDGVSLRRYDVNEWTEISREHPNKAYEKAARVWSKVQKAASFNEASNILSAAGISLHGYCGMD